MATGFSTEPLLIKYLLADPFLFTAPSFQRGYSWREEEAGQLLEDFMQAMSEGGSPNDGGPDNAGPGNGGNKAAIANAGCDSYFLGSILLVEAGEGGPCQSGGLPSDGPRRVFEIIDGLQRLLTLTVLFCVLRDLDNSAEQAIAGRLEQLISVPEEPGRLRVAMDGQDAEFLSNMVQRPGASADMPLHDNLTQGQRNLLEVREFFAAELLEMDDEERDRLVDFVLNYCAVAVIVTQNIDCGHKMFKVLNERGKPLARNDIFKADILGPLAPADEDYCLARWEEASVLLGKNFETLFSHIRTIYGKQNIRIISEIRRIAVETGGGRSFIDGILLPMARAYHVVLIADAGDLVNLADAATALRIGRSLHFLGSLKGADWVPPAMSWISRNASAPEQVALFLQELERYSFCLRVLGLGRDKRLRRYNDLLDWIDRGAELNATSAAMRFGRDEQRLILRNLRNLHSRNPKICKLVLLRLSADMALESGGEERFDQAEYTVEHVLPQKPPMGGEWRRWFSNADTREKCTLGLGNLVLVTTKQNRKAGSGEFAHKLNVYFGASDQPMPKLTESLLGLTVWEPDFVLKRDSMMMDRLKAMWRIDLARNSTRSVLQSA